MASYSKAVCVIDGSSKGAGLPKPMEPRKSHPVGFGVYPVGFWSYFGLIFPC